MCYDISDSAINGRGVVQNSGNGRSSLDYMNLLCNMIGIDNLNLKI